MLLNTCLSMHYRKYRNLYYWLFKGKYGSVHAAIFRIWYNNIVGSCKAFRSVHCFTENNKKYILHSKFFFQIPHTNRRIIWIHFKIVFLHTQMLRLSTLPSRGSSGRRCGWRPPTMHWEIPESFLPFVIDTLRDVEVLRANAAIVASVYGTLECWQFVCALRCCSCALHKM